MICYKVILINPPNETTLERILIHHGDFPIKFRRLYKAKELALEINNNSGLAKIERGITLQARCSKTIRTISPFKRRKETPE
jgi:hypothetical protein